MIIGYQGTRGSNTERAAVELAKRQGIARYHLEPCLTSQKVAEKLIDGRIDRGVMAIENNVAGPVAESAEVLQDYPFNEVERCTLPIIHSLYCKSSEQDFESIEVIYSHEQALAQCKTTLQKLCPRAKLIAMDDTALAARSLSEGAYPPASAVVCSKAAGTQFGLVLMQEAVQDRADNATTFVLLSSPSSSVTEPPGRLERLVASATSQKSIEWGVKGAVVATILGSFFVQDYFGWSSFDTALTLAGTASAIVLLLTSRHLREWVQLQTLKGYWKYEVEPKLGVAPESQQHDIVRAVHIDRGDFGLRLRGWREGDGDGVRWEDKKTLVSMPGTSNGSLVYWYTNTHSQADEDHLDGVVSLTWTKTHRAQKVNRMSGWYTGFATGDVGVIRYVRISKAEFDRLRFKDR